MAHLEAYRILVLAASKHLATRQKQQSNQAQLAIDVQATRAEKEELDQRVSEPAEMSTKIAHLESELAAIQDRLWERWQALALCPDRVQE